MYSHVSNSNSDIHMYSHVSDIGNSEIHMYSRVTIEVAARYWFCSHAQTIELVNEIYVYSRVNIRARKEMYL